MKEKLRMLILERIELLCLTQTAAAKVAKVTQPRMSNLENGKLDRFSIDSLIDIASRLGIKLQLVEETIIQNAFQSGWDTCHDRMAVPSVMLMDDDWKKYRDSL